MRYNMCCTTYNIYWEVNLLRTLKGILIATLIFTLFISSATPTLAKEEQSSSETPILVKEELNMDDGPSMGTFAVIEPGPGDPPFKLVE